MNMKKIVTLVMALVLLLGCGAEAAVSSTGSANTVGSTDTSGEKEKQDERYVKLFTDSYFNYYILFKQTKKINKILIFEFIFLQIKIPIYCVDVFLFDADVAKGDLG